MNTPFQPVSIQPLTPALRALANAQAQVDSAEQQLELLTTQHGSVQAYLATHEILQVAQDAVENARDTVSMAALSAFDGRCTRLHHDVQIAQQEEVNLLNQTAALLWLICHQPDVVNLDAPEKMRVTLRQQGYRNKLHLSRSKALAAVEALFERPAVKVCGWIALEGSAETRWRHVVVPDEASRVVARRIVEDGISADFGRRAWCWAQEPLLIKTTVKSASVCVSEPISMPFARIRQDLSSLVTDHPALPSACTYSPHGACQQKDTS